MAERIVVLKIGYQQALVPEGVLRFVRQMRVLDSYWSDADNQLRYLRDKKAVVSVEIIDSDMIDDEKRVKPAEQPVPVADPAPLLQAPTDPPTKFVAPPLREFLDEYREGGDHA